MIFPLSNQYEICGGPPYDFLYSVVYVCVQPSNEIENDKDLKFRTKTGVWHKTVSLYFGKMTVRAGKVWHITCDFRVATCLPSFHFSLIFSI